MRTWRRADRDCLCGGCGAHILEHDPVQVIRLTGVQRERVRCVTCADEPFDPAKIVERAPRPMADPHQRPMHAVRRVTRDFKLVATGDREVGEEG